MSQATISQLEFGRRALQRSLRRLPELDYDNSILAGHPMDSSALNFGGEPLRLLNMARLGEIRLDVSAPVLDEVERVLCKKFSWAPADAKEIRAEIERFANVITPSESLTVVKADPDDDKIVECSRRSLSFRLTAER